MKKRFATLVFVGIAMTIQAQTPVYLDVTVPIERRVEDALSRMTLQEKVDMCHAQSKFTSPGVPRLGIPELWMSDGPHGVRDEIAWNTWNSAEWTNDSATSFPALTCLAATWNPEMSRLYGQAIGEEARYREKDVLLGPGVNIYRTPLNGRNYEYMGEDPYLAAQMCVPYIQELQKYGVAACIKHYAVNNQETQRWTIDARTSERALREIYLPAFKAAVQEGGAWSLMGAYNKYNGTHACHNDKLLNKILKEEWGFDGVVVSDWSGTHDTREAALNGLDLEMGTDERPDKGLTKKNFTFDESFLGNDYLEGLQKGIYPVSGLDDKVRRILRLIFRTAMNTEKPFGSKDYAAHSAICRRIGSEGVVLLQNNAPRRGESPLLPIDADRYERILVVGDNATRSLSSGGGAAGLKPHHENKILDALKNLYGDKVSYAKGYEPGRSFYGSVDKVDPKLRERLRKEAIEMAKEADLVIFVGGLNKSRHQDCEDGDRLTYDLDFGQNELLEGMLAVNPNIVTVLVSGNAVRIPFPEKMPAILQAWYIGAELGPVVADVLCGEVNPSGKLPFSFPARLEECAAHSFGTMAYPGDGTKVEYLEDILVGYRWHDTKRIPALYPFGHGLSYTTFAYGKPVASSKRMTDSETLSISLKVKNIGKRAGKEVVQLYIGDDKASVLRPLKELKHFTKIALEPGEEQEVTFTITPDDLKFYDETTFSWIAESGTFKAYIGTSSTDIRQIVHFTLK